MVVTAEVSCVLLLLGSVCNLYTGSMILLFAIHPVVLLVLIPAPLSSSHRSLDCFSTRDEVRRAVEFVHLIRTKDIQDPAHPSR